MPSHYAKAVHNLLERHNHQSNAEIIRECNRSNGVSEPHRKEMLQLFRDSGNAALDRLIDHYTASMNQDQDPARLAGKPSKPKLSCGSIPEGTHESCDILGVGGMFAYLNVAYQAHKHGGSHCIITHPQDIFTFSGWTVHPEEDMDQRLIQMFQTKSLFINEVKHLLGLREAPQSLRFKSFRMDYRAMSRLARTNPGEFLKNIKVALQYALLELTDSEKRYARMNLTRNAATIKALEEMGCVGSDPRKHIINLCGRVVYEVSGESTIAAKAALKREFGLLGKRLSAAELRSIYGTELAVFQDMQAGRIDAAQYPGGHFLLGYKDNALRLAGENHVRVYDNAVVTGIICDRQLGKFAVVVRSADHGQKIISANVVLAALGDYADDVITVDGISTLFVITTDDPRYRIFPTGMGEGGTIHIVPVWSAQTKDGAGTLHHHLGKSTNGAIMGRDPARHKRLQPDRSFLLHLEAHLKKIIPPAATFLWLAATECGRPVSARQGYSVKPLRFATNCHRDAERFSPPSFAATGGCGLGGNTAIIPEVQQALDDRIIAGRRQASVE